MAATPAITTAGLGTISDVHATKIMAALKGVTAALLTNATELLAMNLANQSRSLTEQEIHDEISQLYISFLKTIP